MCTQQTVKEVCAHKTINFECAHNRHTLTMDEGFIILFAMRPNKEKPV
jgi:hypothetical protein